MVKSFFLNVLLCSFVIVSTSNIQYYFITIEQSDVALGLEKENNNLDEYFVFAYPKIIHDFKDDNFEEDLPLTEITNYITQLGLPVETPPPNFIVS